MKPGRTSSVILTLKDKRDLALLYLESNKDKNSGSATMAAREFAKSHPELKAVLDRRSSKHSLPAAVRQALAPAQHLIAMKRQGVDKGSRSKGYVPGRLRMTDDGSRRLWGGEQCCSDDGTINFGVVIPWPWGGCRCSEKYGVKLGRFQLLPVHDDATSYIPAWSYIVRPEQSYKGTDVAGLLLRFCRDMFIPDKLVLEGGVWQALRALAVLGSLGIELRDAKGRPQLKLIENWFNRFWTRLSIETGGQVGRSLRDDLVGQKLYVDCQAGRKDPTHYFPMLEFALHAIEAAIRWLNEEPIESKIYGSWIPAERFAADLDAHPRARSVGENLWLASPVMEERTVLRGMIKITADGPFGLRTQYHFTGGDLWNLEGRTVLIAFDPLQNPAIATIADPKTQKVLAHVASVDAWAKDANAASAEVKAVRQILVREYRVITPDGKGNQRITAQEREVRGPDRVDEIRRGDTAVPEPIRLAEAATPSVDRVRHDGRSPAPDASRVVGADLSRSIRRRAASVETADAAW